MTDFWIGAFSVLTIAAAAASLTAAVMAIREARGIGRDLDSLTSALNAHGAGLSYINGEYVPTALQQPLAPEPGDIPTTPTERVVERATHALKDPITSAPPPLPHGVRDWLVHYSTTPGVTWAGVVEQFYTAAAGDPEIAAYFANTDMTVLKKHFTATMIIVTRDGIAASTVRAMGHAHHGITDPHGNPMRVTDDVFNRTVGALATVLHRNGVPENAIAALAATIEPLRVAIVCNQ